MPTTGCDTQNYCNCFHVSPMHSSSHSNLTSGPTASRRLLTQVTYDLQVAKTKSHVPCFHLTFLQVADTLDPFLVFETFFFSWILPPSKVAPWLPDLFTTQSSHGTAPQVSALSPIPFHSHQGSSTLVAIRGNLGSWAQFCPEWALKKVEARWSHPFLWTEVKHTCGLSCL